MLFTYNLLEENVFGITESEYNMLLEKCYKELDTNIRQQNNFKKIFWLLHNKQTSMIASPSDYDIAIKMKTIIMEYKESLLPNIIKFKKVFIKESFNFKDDLYIDFYNLENKIYRDNIKFIKQRNKNKNSVKTLLDKNIKVVTKRNFINNTVVITNNISIISDVERLSYLNSSFINREFVFKKNKSIKRKNDITEHKNINTDNNCISYEKQLKSCFEMYGLNYTFTDVKMCFDDVINERENINYELYLKILNYVNYVNQH